MGTVYLREGVGYMREEEENKFQCRGVAEENGI